MEGEKEHLKVARPPGTCHAYASLFPSPLQRSWKRPLVFLFSQRTYNVAFCLSCMVNKPAPLPVPFICLSIEVFCTMANHTCESSKKKKRKKEKTSFKACDPGALEQLCFNQLPQLSNPKSATVTSHGADELHGPHLERSLLDQTQPQLSPQWGF